MIPNFILAVTCPESGLHRAGQRDGAYRSLEQRDVTVPGKVGQQRAAGSQRGTGAEEDNDRQIGPRWLCGQDDVQLFGCRSTEGFFRQYGDCTASLQRRGQAGYIRTHCGVEAVL
jgi:hypothetical protein